jgi:hypothetical protein
MSTARIVRKKSPAAVKYREALEQLRMNAQVTAQYAMDQMDDYVLPDAPRGAVKSQRGSECYYRMSGYARAMAAEVIKNSAEGCAIQLGKLVADEMLDEIGKQVYGGSC